MSDSYFELRKIANKFSEKLEKDGEKSSSKMEADSKVKKLKKVKRKAQKAQKKLDKKLARLEDQFVKLARGVTMKLKYFDEDGNKVKVRVPAKCIVCEECDGAGQVTSSHEDIGDNDCAHCKGKGSHKVFDSDRASDEEIKAYELYCENKDQPGKSEALEDEDEGEDEGEEDDDEESLEEDSSVNEEDDSKTEMSEELAEKLAERRFLLLKKNASFNMMTDALPKIFNIGKSLTSMFPSWMPGSSQNLEKLMSLFEEHGDDIKKSLENLKKETAQGLGDIEQKVSEEDSEEKEEKEGVANLAKNLGILHGLSDKGLDSLNAGNLTDAVKFIKPLLNILGKSEGAAGLSELGLSELAPLLGELGGAEGLLAGLGELGPLLALL